MRKFTNVDTIEFWAKAKGYGIVNFDSTEQISYLRSVGLTDASFYNKGQALENIKLGKRIVSQIPGTEDMGFRIVVSKDCLRHHIFDESMKLQDPNLFNIPYIRYRALAHPDMLLRGYCMPSKSGSISRSSALSIEDAVEDGPFRKKISLSFHSRSGQKESNKGKDSNDKADTTIYKEETVGDIRYNIHGGISMENLQFIPADPQFGRINVDVDGGENEQTYLKALEGNLVNFKPEFKFYFRPNSYVEDNAAEWGILLNADSVDMLVKRQLRKILEMRIFKAGANMEIESLTIGVIHDGTEEKVEISLDNLDDFYFEYKPYYKEADEEKIFQNRKAVAEKKKKKKKTVSAEENTNQEKIA